MVKHTKRSANRRRARRTKKRGGDASSSPKTPLTPGKTQALINKCRVHYENLAEALKKNENLIETVSELYDFLIKNPLPFLKNEKFRDTLYEKMLAIEIKIGGDDNIDAKTLEEYRTNRNKLQEKVNKYSHRYTEKELFQL